MTSLSTPFVIDGHSVYVSASVGISVYPSDGTEPDVLVKNADTAMYRVKQSGRNAYQFYFPQMQARATERLRLESQLRGALDRDEYQLYYQPKIDLDGPDQRPRGAVALAEPGSRPRTARRVHLGVGRCGTDHSGGRVGDRDRLCTDSPLAERGSGSTPGGSEPLARQFRQQCLDEVIGRIVTESGSTRVARIRADRVDPHD